MGGHTIDTEKFLHSAENKRVHLENFRRNYKLGVGRHHGIYRNFKSYTENRCHTVVLVNFCTCCTICQALVSLGNITNSGESMSSGGTNMGWQRVCVSVCLCVCVSVCLCVCVLIMTCAEWHTHVHVHVHVAL